jgi:hypothetical protein
VRESGWRLSRGEGLAEVVQGHLEFGGKESVVLDFNFIAGVSLGLCNIKKQSGWGDSISS